MRTRAGRISMWAAPIVLLVAAVVVAVVPHLTVGSSRATLTTSTSATGNVATAAACTAGSASWGSNSNGGILDTNVLGTAARKSWNRFGGASAISADTWMTASTWTATTTTGNIPTYGAAGALYCDADKAITLPSAAAYTATASVTQSTFAMNSTTTNLALMLWFKTSTASASSLASVSDGTNLDRVLWVDASGYLRFSGRSGNAGTSWTTAATGAKVNDGTWHYVAAIMTPFNASAGGVTLYLDGASLLSETNHTSPFRSFTANVRWTVGDTLVASNGPTGAPVAGAVGSFDEFVLASTNALSAAQILTLYRSADQ
jgi:hypothetical protein